MNSLARKYCNWYPGLSVVSVALAIRDAPDIRLIQKPDTGYPAGLTTILLVKYQINL
jgi:hypothetical protein